MVDDESLLELRIATESSEGDPEARKRWSKRMRTDPLFRRRKLAHWQFQIDFAREHGWPDPEHAVGGIDFYGRVDQEWQRERKLVDPEGWGRENAEIETSVAEWRTEYAARQAATDARVEAQHEEIEADRLARPPSGKVTEATGKLDGRHPSDYVDDVKALLRDKRDGEAESLLLRLLDVIEDESEATGQGVAPWFYERLAILYSNRHDHASEVATLERFARQRHSVGATPPKLLARLEKARGKLGT